MSHTDRTAAPKASIDDVIGRAQVAALIGKAAQDNLRVVGIASFYMVAVGALLGVLWAPLRDVFRALPAGMNNLVSAISGGTDLSTPAGWANAELLSLLAPAAAIVVGVRSASRVAAEEETKTLGLTLAGPLHRLTFLGSRMAATAVLVAIVAGCVAIGLTIGNLIGKLGFSLAGVFGAAAHTLFLGLLFGAIAFLLAGATGNARLCTIVPALIAVLSFAASTFFPLNDTLKGAARFSPWHYYLASGPLQHGADAGDLAVLGVGAVLLAAAAVHLPPPRPARLIGARAACSPERSRVGSAWGSAAVHRSNPGSALHRRRRSSRPRSVPPTRRMLQEREQIDQSQRSVQL